jgi:hypothetical protein
MATTLDLHATAAYGKRGQFVARIVGRDPKFTFEREFLAHDVTVDDPGLYEVRSIDSRNRKESVFTAFDGTHALGVSEDTAMALAKSLDTIDWPAEVRRLRIAHVEERIALSEGLDQDKIVTLDGRRMPRSEALALRRAELAGLLTGAAVQVALDAIRRRRAELAELLTGTDGIVTLDGRRMSRSEALARRRAELAGLLAGTDPRQAAVDAIRRLMAEFAITAGELG